jgi:hypothetical protein
MLVMVRLFPKGGMNNLCSVIEAEKRNLYWEDVEPLYAIRQEGKRYLSILLKVKRIDSIQKVFLKNLETMAAVRDTRTIPIMSPIYFPPPDGHPKDLQRFLVFLRVAPENYGAVYDSLIELKWTKSTFLTYLSNSFGDDDIILSVLSKDRETARGFVERKIAKLEGVVGYDTSRVVNSLSLLPPEKLEAHKDRFRYSNPAGKKGKMVNKEALEAYTKERSPMTVIVRLFSKSSIATLWDDVEKNIQKYETDQVTPLYASQQENKEFINVIFEVTNFEVLKDFLVNNIPTFSNVRKTRTIPLISPTYFLLPKDHPSDLYRYLISIRGDPSQYQSIRSKFIAQQINEPVFPTYLSFSLGQDDILLSILTDSRRSAQKFAKDVLDPMDGVMSYDISNQLRTKRLASKERWKKHQNKFMSSHDKQHRKEYDSRYDWTDDFKTFAAMTGAFLDELEN